MKRAVVLLSGGVDSSTTLYHAKAKGCSVYALIFDYRQRHRRELISARGIAREARCPYVVIKCALPWRGSSLLDTTRALPRRKVIDIRDIPSTYVPARNIIFLSYAASMAEAIGARIIMIGATAIDYAGYPDCRPDFLHTFEDALRCGTRSGVSGKPLKIVVPFLHKTKAQIIREGMKLKVPYHLTWSCYAGGRRPCGVCDSCVLRSRGFSELEIKDPLA